MQHVPKSKRVSKTVMRLQTEPYDIWEGLDRRSEEYKQLKEERSQVLTPISSLATSPRATPLVFA